jgi:hypothetical protein
MFSERQPRSGREVGLTSCLQLGGSLRLKVSLTPNLLEVLIEEDQRE